MNPNNSALDSQRRGDVRKELRDGHLGSFAFTAYHLNADTSKHGDTYEQEIENDKESPPKSNGPENLPSISSITTTMCKEATKPADSKASQLLKFYFIFLVFPCIISMWYILGTFFPPEARANAPFFLWCEGYMARNDNGQVEICPYAAICAQGLAQVILIGISRLTAFASYAAIALTFISKMHSTIHFLSSTYLSTIVPFESLHDVHKTAGNIFAWLALFHTIAHHLRYLLRHQIDQFGTQSYISGAVAMVSIVIITLSMSSLFKKCLKFEVRFNAHWFFVVLVAGLSFHSGRTRIIVSTFFCLWLLDYIYGIFFRTYRLGFVEFTPISENAGTQLLWRNPDGFNVKSGEYVQIKLTWLAHGGSQWHPFSVYLQEATQEGLNELHCPFSEVTLPRSLSSTSLVESRILELEVGEEPETFDQFVQRIVDSNFGNLHQRGAEIVVEGEVPKYENLIMDGPEDYCKKYNTTQVFISPIGDWSKGLFEQVKETRHLRSCSCWVRGPYTSPYFIAHDFHHFVLTASGIGITPALGVMGQYQANTRTKVLIWSTRSKTMLKFFAPLLKDAHLSVVYYTNKNDLLTNREMLKLRSYRNIFIQQSRPESLTNTIEYIITSIEHCMSPMAMEDRNLMTVDITHRAAWCVLYCGGSVEIRNQLHQFTKDKGLGWECEQFNW